MLILCIFHGKLCLLAGFKGRCWPTEAVFPIFSKTRSGLQMEFPGKQSWSMLLSLEALNPKADALSRSVAGRKSPSLPPKKKKNQLKGLPRWKKSSKMLGKKQQQTSQTTTYNHPEVDRIWGIQGMKKKIYIYIYIISISGSFQR